MRIDGLPPAVKRGDGLSLDIALGISPGNAPDTVFNVRFVSPSGECRFHMRRNIDAPRGLGRVVFPMAYNDAVGRWRVIARDALTGMTAEKSFVLE